MKICHERKRRTEFLFFFVFSCCLFFYLVFLIKEMREHGSDRKCEARREREGGEHPPPTLDTEFTRRM